MAPLTRIFACAMGAIVGTTCGISPAGAVKLKLHLIEQKPIFDSSVLPRSPFKLELKHTSIVFPEELRMRNGAKLVNLQGNDSSVLLHGSASTAVSTTPVLTTQRNVTARFGLDLQKLVPKIAPDLSRQLQAQIDKAERALKARTEATPNDLPIPQSPKLASLAPSAAPVAPDLRGAVDRARRSPASVLGRPQNGVQAPVPVGDPANHPLSPSTAPSPFDAKMPPMKPGSGPPGGMLPEKNGQTPPRMRPMPAGNGMMPPGSGMMPPGNGMMPPGSGMMPPGSGMMPPGNVLMPHGNPNLPDLTAMAKTAEKRAQQGVKIGLPNVNAKLAVPNVNAKLAVPNVKAGLALPNVNAKLALPNVNAGLALPNVSAKLALPSVDGQLAKAKSGRGIDVDARLAEAKTNAQLVAARAQQHLVALRAQAKLAPASMPSIARDANGELLGSNSSVVWDAWHKRFAKLAGDALLASINRLDAPLGSNSVNITITPDNRLTVSLAKASNPKFDQAVLQAYKSLNGSHALNFPPGSLRSSISFVVDNKHTSKGVASVVHSKTFTGDREMLRTSR